MSNLEILADFVRDLHDHPTVTMGVTPGQLHTKLVEGLDDLGLGNVYRDFAAAMSDVGTYSLRDGVVVRNLDLDEVL